MSVPEAALDVIGVLVRISELMMLAVLRGPFQRRLLEGCGAEKKQKEANYRICFIGNITTVPL